MKKLLADDAPLGIKELAAHLNKSERSSRTVLKRLTEVGYIIEIKTSPTDPRKAYLLTAQGRRLSNSF